MMQSNFDPNLYKSIDESKKAQKTYAERNVERGRHVEDRDHKRKKFDLDEQLGEKDGKKVGEEPAKGLASTTRKKQGKGSGGTPHDLISEKGGQAKSKEAPRNDQPFHITMMQNQAESELQHVAKAPKPVKSVQEMIKLLVASIQEMKQAGKTDTTLTIQHPPIFAGAKLTVTTYSTAKGEFNITFSELTPEAKQMLDQNLARESLMQNLQEKGYVVHMMIATTEKEETALTMNEPRLGKEKEEKEEKEPQEDEQ